MRDSKLLLIAILAVGTAWQLCAQTASPELQRRALEVLRQAVAQQEAAQALQGTKAAPAPTVPAQPAEWAPTQGTKVAPVQVTVPAQSAGWVPTQGTKVAPAQPLPPSIPSQPGATVVAPAVAKAPPPQVLPAPSHPGQEGWQPSTQVVPRVSSPRGAANAPAPVRPQGMTPARTETRPQLGQGQGPGTAVVPQASSGPKTKQQRLDELLQRYLADEITPPEYHAERRRILGGP